MKQFLLVLALTIFAVASADRPARHHSTLGWFFGSKFWKENVGCRFRHWRTLIDKDGEVKKCIPRCTENHEIGYSLKYGHFCKEIDLPEGCRDRYCFRCSRGYYRLDGALFGEEKCVKKCPERYIRRGRQCIKLATGCADVYCRRCEPGWYSLKKTLFIKLNSCVEKCPLGYGPSKPGNRCMRCRQYGCMDCSSDAFVCKECNFGFKLLTSNDEVKCVSQCPDGYESFIDEENVIEVCKKENKTKVVPEGCADTSCIACKEGYYKFSLPGSSICTETCPAGFGVLMGTCVRCSVPNCDVCTADATKCIKCKPDVITQKGAENETVSCLNNCPVGTKKVVQDGELICKAKATKNCTVKNCEECLDSDLHNLHAGCIRCKDGFLLKRDIFSDRCLQRCPNGFYEGFKPGTNISACLNCQVPFCKSCVSAKKCFSCMSPFVISEETGLCTMCPYGTVYDTTVEKCKPIRTKPIPTTVPDLSDVFRINKV